MVSLATPTSAVQGDKFGERIACIQVIHMLLIRSQREIFCFHKWNEFALKASH